MKKRVIVAWFAVLALVAGAVIALSYKARQPSDMTLSARGKFIRNSLAHSRELVQQGIMALREHDTLSAIKWLRQAIDVFPANTDAYMLLMKTYLMTRQEDKMYEVMEFAGPFYPSFDKMVEVLDDKDLEALGPIEEKGNVYIAPFKDNRQMALSFMFDDGESSVYTGILPIFEKYGFRATVPIVVKEVADEPGNPFRGSWSQWRDAVRRGFEIANHSMWHRDAQTVPPQDYQECYLDSQQEIERQVGQKVVSFVFPLDHYSKPVLEYVVRIMPAVRMPRYLRAIHDRTVSLVYGGMFFSAETANRLVDIGIQRKLWITAECHGLEASGQKSYKPVSPQLLEQHLSYLKKRSSHVWVDTFGRVFQYVWLRKSSRVERRDTADGQAQIILRNHSQGADIPVPLTVVLRVDGAITNIGASAPDGSVLRAWPCEEKGVCVEVGTYDVPVRVRWR